MCDTLVGDANGVYHPALFGDRLLLGLMGIMSEAELHVLRARLTGGIRNKAARGELRRGLPAGLIWGEAPGEIMFHPDEAVTGVIAAVFGQFAVRGSARAVWLWLREQNLRWPLQQATTVSRGLPEITWVEPTYKAVLTALRHPAYAGAYVYGRTRAERYVDEHGRLRTRRRDLPSDQWEVLIPGHHDGFIDWDAYQDIQRRLDGNIPPAKGAPGTGAVREGSAHLQTLASCGVCGRKAAVYYDGEHKATPGYYCTGGSPGASRGSWHLRVGGAAIDAAVTGAFLATLGPAALQACLAAAGQLEAGYDIALDQHRRQVEQARYQAAESRTPVPGRRPRKPARGARPGNPMGACPASTIRRRSRANRREKARPATLTEPERAAILALGDDLGQVWNAPTTTDKDRKQLLRTLLNEVTITVHRDQIEGHAELLLRWKGGAISELTVPLKRQPPKNRTGEDTVELFRRLAVHYADGMIAAMLNKQGRTTATGLSFTPGQVQSLRHHWGIPRHQPSDDPPEGELRTVADAARQLGLAPSTLHRWVADGFVPGEQLTPGAPWRPDTGKLRASFADDAPAGWLPVREAIRAHSVSPQTLLQRVKRGELHAVHVRTGRTKGLRIEPPPAPTGLF